LVDEKAVYLAFDMVAKKVEMMDNRWVDRKELY